MTDPTSLAQPTLPLASLVLDPDFNARLEDEADDAEFEANLRDEGIEIPFLVYVTDSPGVYAVADGGRRWQILQKWRAAGDIGDDFEVPVRLKPRPHTKADARAASASVNLFRRPLHPVDEYEAYAGLIANGWTTAGVAMRFGIGERTVRQRLALAALAPQIRVAWRAGKLGPKERASEIAAAFTIVDDHAAQMKVYASLFEKHRLYPLEIRKALAPSNPQETRRLLNFVTAEAYIAAGGEVVEDLFGDELYVDDFAALKRLADERLEAECAALRAAGWTHAETRAAVGEDIYCRLVPLAVPPEALAAAETEDDRRARAAAREARSAYERAVVLFNDRAEKFSDDEARAEEEKLDTLEEAADAAEERVWEIDDAVRRRALEADSGLRGDSAAIVSITADGRLEVKTGLRKPKSLKSLTPEPSAPDRAQRGKADGPPEGAARKARERAGGLAKKTPPGGLTLNDKSMTMLGDALTRAARDSLLGRPGHALALYLAALDADAPVFGDLSPVLAEDRPTRRERPGLLARAEEFLAADDKELLAMLGARLAAAADFTWAKFLREWPGKDERALAEALPREAFMAALAVRLDLAAFFKAAGRDAALAAIADCQGADEALSASTRKMSEILAYAATRAREKNWLPEPLRFSFYAGPATETAWPPRAKPENRSGKGRPPKPKKEKPAKKKAAKKTATKKKPARKKTAAAAASAPQPDDADAPAADISEAK